MQSPCYNQHRYGVSFGSIDLRIEGEREGEENIQYFQGEREGEANIEYFQGEYEGDENIEQFEIVQYEGEVKNIYFEEADGDDEEDAENYDEEDEDDYEDDYDRQYGQYDENYDENYDEDYVEDGNEEDNEDYHEELEYELERRDQNIEYHCKKHCESIINGPISNRQDAVKTVQKLLAFFQGSLRLKMKVIVARYIFNYFLRDDVGPQLLTHDKFSDTFWNKMKEFFYYEEVNVVILNLYHKYYSHKYKPNELAKDLVD